MGQIVCEWGLNGIEAFRSTAAVFVIVDVLSFSTAVSVAVDRGAEVIPFPWGDPEAAQQEAKRRGAVAASPKRAAGQQLSLSPASLRQVSLGTRLLLPSPNGSRLSLATGETPTYCACLRNFGAVAGAVRDTVQAGSIGVIPAGERWGDGSLRPAIEDWIGAGAVIAALGGEVSSEALAARLAYEAVRSDLAPMIRGSISGRELIDRGFAEDVEIALEVGQSRCAPRLRDGSYREGLLTR
ncbi:MAG TPA: 2-phosphosulfolactate phosphatase [Caulobacteraceae bacterium]|jgi:2-phosphosulfolactate phosphatase